MQAELDGATAKLNEAESRLSTTRTEITETWVRIGGSRTACGRSRLA